jgi:hypothetical protein
MVLIPALQVNQAESTTTSSDDICLMRVVYSKLVHTALGPGIRDNYDLPLALPSRCRSSLLYPRTTPVLIE